MTHQDYPTLAGHPLRAGRGDPVRAVTAACGFQGRPRSAGSGSDPVIRAIEWVLDRSVGSPWVASVSRLTTAFPAFTVPAVLRRASTFSANRIGNPQTVVGNLLSVEGRVVVVTGGGKGIGRVYCRELARAGARIVAADIDDDANEATVGEIRAAGGEAVAATTDVADEGRTAEMARTAVAAFGRIDGLVNNASLMSVLERRDWNLIPGEEWDRVMEVNLRGIFLCCRAVHPQMKEQGGGKIVNISSGRFWNGAPNRLHYSTSKAGVIGLTRSLAREVGPDNICVNAITPGFTLSDTQVASSGEYAQTNAPPEDRCIQRHQYPEDLVGAVTFLLSPGSDFISGQTLNVDGGQQMH